MGGCSGWRAVGRAPPPREGALETPVGRGGVEWALLGLCWARTGAEVERGFLGARGAQLEC